MQLPDQLPIDHGKILNRASGIGAVDESEIEERARELAEIDGLDADQVNQGHRDQARLELLGAANADAPNDDSGPIAGLINRDDVAGESGGAAYTSTNAGAHGDEQTIGEQLYGEGITEADHDRMSQSRSEERRELE